MPNLVVYVPTKLWNRIHEMGLSDPKVEARKVAVGALEAWLSTAAVEAAEPAPSGGRVVPVRAYDAAAVESQPKRRAHPCKHHVPPSRHCDYCDA